MRVRVRARVRVRVRVHGDRLEAALPRALAHEQCRVGHLGGVGSEVSRVGIVTELA